MAKKKVFTKSNLGVISRFYIYKCNTCKHKFKTLEGKISCPSCGSDNATKTSKK